MSPPKMLGILLCYNDGDLVEDSITYLLEQNHDVIVWDHGSTDETAEVVRRLGKHLLETTFVPRSFDFYQLYPSMSAHIMSTYLESYDWISWPDQDEFLEGPSRSKTYRQWVEEVWTSRFDWVQFNNLNYWFTSVDDSTIPSPTERIRHYSIFPDCAPRIRAWKAAATNVRIFNHNEPDGVRYPDLFNLRHYPMRSETQMLNRIYRDRAGLRRGDSNYHYENLKVRVDELTIAPDRLHYDDGVSELNLEAVFDWRSIYGHAPPVAARL
ncbi:MAG TPA: glycosyltransferase family 2 protein [Terriglobales bacterium]|nr:glycosyltransferase family 2 protein [Terriglobales bacterium]